MAGSAEGLNWLWTVRLREGSAIEKLPISCPFCPPNDYLRRGSGNALSGTNASEKPHFLERPGYAEEVGRNSWLLHAHFSTAGSPVSLSP